MLTVTNATPVYAGGVVVMQELTMSSTDMLTVTLALSQPTMPVYAGGVMVMQDRAPGSKSTYHACA